MNPPVVARLFAAVGTPAPPTGTPMARAFSRCPRSRLVRVVAWYGWESWRGDPSDSHLSEGIRLLIRGWDDFYITLTLPSGALIVNVEGNGQAGAALVTRRGRAGRGWFKETFSTRGEVRPEIEVATRWLGSIVGCIVHDDCAAHPDLGLACANATRG